jgi:hypothetical protein
MQLRPILPAAGVELTSGQLDAPATLESAEIVTIHAVTH